MMCGGVAGVWAGGEEGAGGGWLEAHPLAAQSCHGELSAGQSWCVIITKLFVEVQFFCAVSYLTGCLCCAKAKQPKPSAAQKDLDTVEGKDIDDETKSVLAVDSKPSLPQEQEQTLCSPGPLSSSSMSSSVSRRRAESGESDAIASETRQKQQQQEKGTQEKLEEKAKRKQNEDRRGESTRVGGLQLDQQLVDMWLKVIVAIMIPLLLLYLTSEWWSGE